MLDLETMILCFYSNIRPGRSSSYDEYTRSRLQRARLLQTPGYNEQIFFIEETNSD